MADIQDKILSKYGIDINQENIFKLYKIDSVDISSEALEVKIQDTHKRWNISINGANEKSAERDRARLEKADKYESMLRDVKLRKDIFNYYNKQTGSSGNGANANGGNTEFAKEYFKLVATTKKIKKDDVDFFFKYYQSERKNKKAILEMLSKELKINGLGKEDQYANDDESQEDGKKKNDSSPMIVNMFQEATILKIRRAIEKYEQALQSAELCQRYPKLREGLYEFLEINDISDAKQFFDIVSKKGKDAYSVRQERGTEYVPLVDLFNILQSISDNQDVVDNILEFKLLLKYPNLTPYMFSFVEMKPNTIKGMVGVAKQEYAFRDDTDFVLNYYKPVHDNFGISDSAISSVLKKADKKAKQNKILNNIDEKLGRSKNKRKIPISAEIIHWLAYWPIFAVYFVFEIAKAIFTELHRFAIPAFAIVFALENWLLPKFGMENLFILRKIFIKSEWMAVLIRNYGDTNNTAFDIIIHSIGMIFLLVVVYVLPGLLIHYIMATFSNDFNKRFDWIGIERTFQQIFFNLKTKSEKQYETQKKLFSKKKMPSIIINIVCLIAILAAVYLIPHGIGALIDKSGYGQSGYETNINEEMTQTDEASSDAIELP